MKNKKSLLGLAVVAGLATSAGCEDGSVNKDNNVVDSGNGRLADVGVDAGDRVDAVLNPDLSNDSEVADSGFDFNDVDPDLSIDAEIAEDAEIPVTGQLIVENCETIDSPDGSTNRTALGHKVVDMNSVFETGANIETGCWTVRAEGLSESISVSGLVNLRGYFSNLPTSIVYTLRDDTYGLVGNWSSGDTTRLTDGALTLNNGDILTVRVARDLQSGQDYSYDYYLVDGLNFQVSEPGVQIDYDNYREMQVRLSNYNSVFVGVSEVCFRPIQEFPFDIGYWYFYGEYGSDGLINSAEINCVDQNGDLAQVNGDVQVVDSRGVVLNSQLVGGRAVLENLSVIPFEGYSISAIATDLEGDYVQCSLSDLTTSFSAVYGFSETGELADAPATSLEIDCPMEVTCSTFVPEKYMSDLDIGSSFIAGWSCSADGNSGVGQMNVVVSYNNFNQPFDVNLQDRITGQILQSLSIPAGAGSLELSFDMGSRSPYDGVVMVAANPAGGVASAPNIVPFANVIDRPILTFDEPVVEGGGMIGEREDGTYGPSEEGNDIRNLPVMMATPFALTEVRNADGFEFIDLNEVEIGQPITIMEFNLKNPYKGGFLSRLEFLQTTGKAEMDNFSVEVLINRRDRILVPNHLWNENGFSVEMNELIRLWSGNAIEQDRNYAFGFNTFQVNLIPRDPDFGGFNESFSISLVEADLYDVVDAERRVIPVGTTVNRQGNGLNALSRDNVAEGPPIFLVGQ